MKAPKRKRKQLKARKRKPYVRPKTEYQLEEERARLLPPIVSQEEFDVVNIWASQSGLTLRQIFACISKLIDRNTYGVK